MGRSLERTGLSSGPGRNDCLSKINHHRHQVLQPRSAPDNIRRTNSSQRRARNLLPKMVFHDRPVYQEEHAAHLIMARSLHSPHKGRIHLRRSVDPLFAFPLQSDGGPYIPGNWGLVCIGHSSALIRPIWVATFFGGQFSSPGGRSGSSGSRQRSGARCGAWNWLFLTGKFCTYRLRVFRKTSRRKVDGR